MSEIKPRSIASIIGSILIAGHVSARGEMFELMLHTLIDPSGGIASQIRGDFEANGILMLENGRIEVEISIAHKTGVIDELQGSGTFEVGSRGTVVTVSYTDGREHSGVVISADPLITLVGIDGYSEVNVWRPANPFLRNAQ